MISRTVALSMLTAVCLLAGPAASEDPYMKPDRSWISLTGTVADTSLERFTLDYGEGLIQVEMDDWDWYDEANRILPGERVTVYGRIDADLYQTRTIEANSVYVFARNTFFYASDADEEEATYVYPSVALVPDGTWMSVTGTVEKVKGREFVLDTGSGKIQVDTILMSYNPLDDVGFQKIDKGDRVSVSGRLDLDFFEKREIQANTIVSLTRDKGKKNSSPASGG